MSVSGTSPSTPPTPSLRLRHSMTDAKRVGVGQPSFPASTFPLDNDISRNYSPCFPVGRLVGAAAGVAALLVVWRREGLLRATGPVRTTVEPRGQRADGEALCERRRCSPYEHIDRGGVGSDCHRAPGADSDTPTVRQQALTPKFRVVRLTIHRVHPAGRRRPTGGVVGPGSGADLGADLFGLYRRALPGLGVLPGAGRARP